MSVMATYRQQQQFIYSICMASKQCREERERAEHTLLLDSIVCQFSLPFSCFPLSPLPFSISCRLLVDQQGNALESAFISGQALLVLLPLLFLLLPFLVIVSLVVVYDLRTSQNASNCGSLELLCLTNVTWR